MNLFLLVEPEVQELSPFISAMIERSDPLVMAQFLKLIPQRVKRRKRIRALKNKCIFAALSALACRCKFALLGQSQNSIELLMSLLKNDLKCGAVMSDSPWSEWWDGSTVFLAAARDY